MDEPLSGLSPRVRGNRLRYSARPAPLGSIPARAGEPRRGLAPGSDAEVYPRACGGTDAGDVLTPTPGGLSPRVRGNQMANTFVGERYGSIPARAGEPSRNRSNIALDTVYPRACGGTRSDRSPGDDGSGSIPARAGEPPQCLRNPTSTAVYPRACGGTLMSRGRSRCAAGLSPRVRGNLSRFLPKRVSKKGLIGRWLNRRDLSRWV